MSIRIGTIRVMDADGGELVLIKYNSVRSRRRRRKKNTRKSFITTTRTYRTASYIQVPTQSEYRVIITIIRENKQKKKNPARVRVFSPCPVAPAVLPNTDSQNLRIMKNELVSTVESTQNTFHTFV